MERKLQVRRETLMELTSGDLLRVRGASHTGPSNCNCLTGPGLVSCANITCGASGTCNCPQPTIETVCNC